MRAEYKICSGTLTECTINVNRLLKDGWLVHGSLAVTSIGYEVTAYQPMVRYINDFSGKFEVIRNEDNIRFYDNAIHAGMQQRD